MLNSYITLPGRIRYERLITLSSTKVSSDNAIIDAQHTEKALIHFADNVCPDQNAHLISLI